MAAIHDDRAAGNLQDGVGPGLPGLSFSAAVVAVLCFVVSLVAEIEKRPELPVGPDDDIAAVTAIAAVGSSFGHIFLPSEADRSVPAVACLDENYSLVNELHVLRGISV